jgi:hypothetical protein
MTDKEAMKVEGPLHVVCQCDKCKAEKQEPVAYLVLFDGAGKLLEFTKGNYLHGAKVEHIPLYTHPPQRTEQGDKHD